MIRIQDISSYFIIKDHKLSFGFPLWILKF